jgi:CTP:phosphocholine cytidylyltransferase-like protein
MAYREEWISGKKKNYENPLNDIISSTLAPIVKNKSKLEADLLLNWNKIFDSNISSKSYFAKVSTTSKKENKFVLHINTKVENFLEIGHSTEIMKEQLAIFLGYNGCEKIFVHKLD